MTPDESRQLRSASDAGAPSRVRTGSRNRRGSSFIEELGRDLTHGARLLRRNPGFAAVVVATLAIAIGATVTVFSIVDAWLVRPLHFPEAERLVIAFGARPERPGEPAVWLPYRAYLAWKERARSFESISAAFVRDVTVSTAADAHTILGLNVTPEFFRTLSVAPLFGRTLVEGDVTGSHVVVLSHGLWQRHFGGSQDAIGTTILLSGVPHEIVGVMPRDFDVRVLDMQFEFWKPFTPGETGYEPGGIGPIAVLGRLRAGIRIEAAQSEAADIMRESEARYPINFNRFVVNLSSLQADNTRTVRLTLLTVSAAVGSLLLIAAMNVGTLLLGRGLARMREAAIRAALGSGRARLVRQFLTESLLITIVGTAVGLAVAEVAIRLFIAWNPLGTLPATSIRIDVRVVAFAGVALMVTTIVCGLMPALRLSTVDPLDALRADAERGATAPRALRAQAAMLVAQMAVCVVLLVATTLLVRTFVRLHSEPLGFDPRNLWVANVVLPNASFKSSEERNAYYRELAERIRALPGVGAVAAGTSPPLHSGAPLTVHTGPEDSADAPRMSAQEVTPEFFATLRIPTLAGRFFDGRDGPSAAPVVILNARAARDLFGGPATAIGRRVRLDREPWREVVGVVGTIRSTFFNTLEWQMNPIVYRPAAQGFSTFSNPTVTSFGFLLHIRADRPVRMADVRNAALSVSARAAVTDLRSGPELISRATRQPAFRMRLLFSFAVLSLLLAALGMYGLVSQVVRQRVREIAIRLALGAEPARVAATLTRHALVCGVAGVMIGGAATLMLGSTFEALLYGVRARDSVSFVTAAAALLTITAVAAFVPAMRAARVDPAKALRAE